MSTYAVGDTRGSFACSAKAVPKEGLRRHRSVITRELGMCILFFVRSNNEIALAVRDDSHGSGWRVTERWKAHNSVASSSEGQWPIGSYAWSHYKAHAEMGVAPACLPSKYGCSGIHVFDVGKHGRTGMGVHAGRTSVPSEVGTVTMGCIRVPEDAMEAINSTHATDRIQAIVVLDHLAETGRVQQQERAAANKLERLRRNAASIE